MKIPRSIKFLCQRIIRGWDDSDTWALDLTISKFTLPRLKRLKEIDICSWDSFNKLEKCNIIDEIIWFHEMIIQTNDLSAPLVEDVVRFNKAALLWGKYYTVLWW